MAPPSAEAWFLVRQAVEAQYGTTPNLNDPSWRAIVDEVDNQLQNGTPSDQLVQVVKDMAPSILAPNGGLTTFGGATNGRINVDPGNAAGYYPQPPTGDAGGASPGLVGYSDAALNDFFNRPDGGSILTPVDADGIRYAVNDKGDVIASFEQAPDGSWVLAGEGTGTVGGTAGSGGSGSGGGLTARDILASEEFQQSFGENKRQFDASLGQDQRQFDASLGQRQLETTLSEGRLNRKDVGDLGLGLGRLNLDQQEYIAEILRNPADFLARAFSQRGGQSPFPEISQADLINRLGDEFNRIRDFTGQQLAGNSRLLAGTPGAVPAAPRINVTPGVPAPGAAPADGGRTQIWYDAAGNPQVQSAYGASAQQNIDNHKVALQEAAKQTGTAPDSWQAVAQEYKNRGYDIPGFAEGTDGPVKSRISLLGEHGPELQINHGDGSFDVIDAPTTRLLLDSGAVDPPSTYGGGTRSRDRVRGYAGGTLDGLTADDLGRLSLFDVAAVAPTSNAQIEQYAQLTTPPGPANLLSGSRIPDLNVSGNDPSVALFSPQEFAKLTPDEQVAARTRLASKNKSLDDYLHASSRFFGGTPRTQSRARIDVTR